jgi:hypothetical protein
MMYGNMKKPIGSMQRQQPAMSKGGMAKKKPGYAKGGLAMCGASMPPTQKGKK